MTGEFAMATSVDKETKGYCMTEEPTSTIEQIARRFASGPSLLEIMGLERGDIDGVALRAREVFLSGKEEDAVSLFVQLVMVDPTNVDYQIGLAETSLATGRAEVAMQSAAVVIADRPTSAIGYFLSGRAALLMGEIEIALEDLEDAIKLAEASGAHGLLKSAKQIALMVSRA